MQGSPARDNCRTFLVRIRLFFLLLLLSLGVYMLKVATVSSVHDNSFSFNYQHLQHRVTLQLESSRGRKDDAHKDIKDSKKTTVSPTPSTRNKVAIESDQTKKDREFDANSKKETHSNLANDHSSKKETKEITIETETKGQQPKANGTRVVVVQRKPIPVPRDYLNFTNKRYDKAIWKHPPPILAGPDDRPDLVSVESLSKDDAEFIKSMDRLRLVRKNNNWNALARVGRSEESLKKKRVMCTVVRNVTPFVKEWLDYHLILGWDRIVVYNHKGTDNLKQVIKDNYPNDVVEYRRIDFPIKGGGLQRMTHAQESAFHHCFERFWNQSELLITTDIDEYTFPGRDHWGEPDVLWRVAQVLNITNKPVAMATRIRCTTFGFGNYDHVPMNQSVVASYSKRAPIAALAEKSPLPAGASFQRFCDDCNWYGLPECRPKYNWTTNAYCKTCHLCPFLEPLAKTIYAPGTSEFKFRRVGVHFPQFQTRKDIYIPGEGWLKNQTQGMICNHYRFRSYPDVLDKAQRNKGGNTLASLNRDHPLFAALSSIKDEKIVEYLVARRHLLRKHNIEIF